MPKTMFRSGTAFSISVALLIGASTPMSGMETVRLQLKWRHQFQFAGYYAAVQQGYYAEAGLEVELIEAKPGKSPMQTVLNGDAEYGIATSDIVRLRAMGEPVVALAVIFQHSPLALISCREAGIETIHDLAGKRIMIQDGGADLLSLLKAEEVPIKSIELVKHDFSYKSLIEGKISAFSGYITNEPQLLEDAGFEPLVFSPKSVGIDFYGDVLFTTETQIRKHPEQVAAFLKASLRGWEFALEHPDVVIGEILEKYSTRKTRAQLEYEAEKSISLIRNDLVDIGHMNPSRWQHIADVLRDEGMISGPVDIDSMLYQPHTPFPTALFLKWTGGAALCFTFLALFAGKQTKTKHQLQAAIRRREQGEELLRKREQEYRDLYEDAPLAFIVWDTELRIRAWNHAAEALFGWSAEEVIGKVAGDFLIPQSAAETVERGKAILRQRGSLTQTINENTTKDGRVIWCKWNSVARKNIDGKVMEFHSIAMDVSAEIEAQHRLENERAEAVGASQAKDELLAQTSHEIRNPLNAIMGFAQILLSEAEDGENKEAAQVILEGSEGMLNILNDLLDSSKIDAGKLELEWSEINLILHVQKEAELFSRLMASKGLNFEVIAPDHLQPVKTDGRRIQQILNNLINNAAKFTKEGGIRIELEDGDADDVILRVRDTGIGMDAATLKHVFEPYAQANLQTSGEYGGTGLGLSLTKKLVTLLQGSLTAESEPGKGSCFTVRLPKHPVTARATASTLK